MNDVVGKPSEREGGGGNHNLRLFGGGVFEDVIEDLFCSLTGQSHFRIQSLSHRVIEVIENRKDRLKSNESRIFDCSTLNSSTGSMAQFPE